MSEKIVQQIIVLKGHHAGHTGFLGGRYEFKNGRTLLVGTEEQVLAMSNYVRNMWEGYPEGHPELENDNGQRDLQADSQQDKQHAVSGDLQPNGEGSGQATADQLGGTNAGAPRSSAELANGDGSAPYVSPNAKLTAAIRQLDPANDEHWTQSGLPAIASVQGIYGQTGFNRKDVEQALPGYTRQIARDLAVSKAGE